MPVPFITSNYLDGNLYGNRRKAAGGGKNVYVIGTAEDGPMHEPVPIANIDDAERVFGRIDKGNLVRGIAEMFSVPGEKRIYGIRIGDGERSYLELRERSYYTDTHAPTPTEVSDTSIALRIEALYPSSKYNDAVLGYTTLPDYGTVLYFYNPITGVRSYYRFSTDPTDTSVPIHNVRELVDALNTDPNFAPWFRASYMPIKASFECWVLPATTDPTYGETGFTHSWSELMDDGKLPSEWSDGADWDGHVFKFSLKDRLVDTDHDEPAVESPSAGGWEVLDTGIVSGSSPRRATETAVNNIINMIKLYSLTHTGPKAISTLEKVAKLDPVPFDTRLRGYTFSALNSYRADGLAVITPNSRPTNEFDPSDGATYASEYTIWYDKTPISGGEVGADNDGVLRFACFLPLDFSGWPKYWANKVFPSDPDPLTKMAIGHAQLWDESTPGAVDGKGVAIKGFHDSLERTISAPIGRDGVADGYYLLPPYVLTNPGGGEVYPYANMVATQATDENYNTLYYILKSDWTSNYYTGYFPGHASLNFEYTTTGFRYDPPDTPRTELPILTRPGHSSSTFGTDVMYYDNVLPVAAQSGTDLVTALDVDYTSAITYAPDASNASCRAYIPAEYRVLNVSGASTPSESGFVADPNSGKIGYYDGSSWSGDLAGAPSTDYILVVTTDSTDIRAAHLASIYASKGLSNRDGYSPVELYYGQQAVPVFEYSLDGGNSWFEVEPRWIAAMNWDYKGQKYPNDTSATNVFTVYFYGTTDPDDNLPDTRKNDIFRVWKPLWDEEVVADPSLSTRYPALESWFSSTDPSYPIDETTWAEFQAWAGDMLPPFLTLSSDGKRLVFVANAQFRLSAVTWKGQLTQSTTRSMVEGTGRADYYFIYGDHVLFGSVPTGKYIVNYMTKIDFIPNVDFIIDNEGVITFVNPSKQPFGSEWSEYKRFLLGFEFEYLPEWFELPAAMSLHGGTDGIYLSTERKYEELQTVLDIMTDRPPEVLVPVDFFVDETVTAYSPDTGLPYVKNAGLLPILSEWLENINQNAWTTRAVVPILNPTAFDQENVNNWIKRATEVSPTDILRPANVIAQTDCKWIDIVGFPFLFAMAGHTWTVTMQCVYAAMLASNVLPDVLTNKPIPRTNHMALIRLYDRSASKLVDARINTVRWSDATGDVIADFVTAAHSGSDYSRALNREIVAEVVKRTKSIWDQFAGKVGTKSVVTAFQTALDKEVRTIGAIEDIQFKIIQTEQMKLERRIQVKYFIKPFGELTHLDVSLELRR